MAHAYLKNKVRPLILVILASIACNLERPDWRFGVQVWIWNIGSLNEKGEVCEELKNRMVDVCGLQEVRWRGCGERMRC